MKIPIVLFSAFLILATSMPGQDETLKYEVSVKVRVVPLFAVTDRGEPVFDLKAEELLFTINGKAITLDALLRREFESEAKEITAPEAKAKAPAAMPPSERIVFILLDYFRLNARSERRLVEITQNIIELGQSYDRFVVFKMQPNQGLQYIAGPEPKNDQIMKKVEKARARGRIAPDMIFRDNFFTGGPGDPTDPELSGSAARLINQEGANGSEQMQYISYFKHALKTFVQPKVVYYISTGFPIEMDAENTAFLNLNHIVRTFREGGASVFAINPSRELGDSMHQMQASRQMLTDMAEQTGGRFFEGTDVKEIVERVKKSNSAYYEAVVNLNQVGDAKEFEVKATCRRAGVRLLVPGTIALQKKYSELEKFEKELFAVDAASGGFWARTQSRVKRAPFRTQVLSEGDVFKYRLSVPIPMQMAEQPADIYLFCIDGRSGKVKSTVQQRPLPAQETLEAAGQKGDRILFTIITQNGAYCICGGLVCGSPTPGGD